MSDSISQLEKQQNERDTFLFLNEMHKQSQSKIFMKILTLNKLADRILRI